MLVLNSGINENRLAHWTTEHAGKVTSGDEGYNSDSSVFGGASDDGGEESDAAKKKDLEDSDLELFSVSDDEDASKVSAAHKYRKKRKANAQVLVYPILNLLLLCSWEDAASECGQDETPQSRAQTEEI